MNCGEVPFKVNACTHNWCLRGRVNVAYELCGFALYRKCFSQCSQLLAMICHFSNRWVTHIWIPIYCVSNYMFAEVRILRPVSCICSAICAILPQIGDQCLINDFNTRHLSIPKYYRLNVFTRWQLGIGNDIITEVWRASSYNSMTMSLSSVRNHIQYKKVPHYC